MREFLLKYNGLINFRDLERKSGIPERTIYKYLSGNGSLSLEKKNKIREVLTELHTDIFTLAL